MVAVILGSVSPKETVTLLKDRSLDEDDGLAAVLATARTATADIALITDSAQTITYASASFTAMTGYEQAEMMGLNCRVLQGPGTDPNTTRHMREVFASGEVFEGGVLNYRKNDSAFWTALKIIPMRVGASTAITHYVSIQRDISNQVALLKQLQNQALHDDVTGLPNPEVHVFPPAEDPPSSHGAIHPLIPRRLQRSAAQPAALRK